MKTLWVGDFRSSQLKYQIDKTTDSADNNIYFIEGSAECSWFTDSFTKHFPLMADDISNVVILLGFNDCVYSCVWEDTFSIKAIAKEYSDTISELAKEYSSINFYICSVSPVDNSYPFAAYSSNGVIPRDKLTAKIEAFNKALKEQLAILTEAAKETDGADDETEPNIVYLNTYDYLKTTGFATHDGILFDSAAIESFLAYIDFFVLRAARAIFKARDTEDKGPTGNPEADGYWWTNYDYGGLNPYVCPTKYKKHEGDTLPNCTAWAWGRFYEILGSPPEFESTADMNYKGLCWGNAEQWWDYTEDGYERGQEPRLGAIACWKDGPTTNSDTTETDGAGHVAIVERINPDGSIITSESGYNTEKYWWLTRRTKDGFYVGDEYREDNNTKGNWGSVYASSKFQGFIYCPVTSFIDKEKLWTENRGGASEEDMKPNAQYTWQYLGERGWSMNAVAALLGNLQYESGMSPCIWESSIKGSKINEDGTHELDMPVLQAYYNNNGRWPGYGLVQWTPYSTLIDWCAARNLPYWDIDSQLERIDWQSNPERTTNESGWNFPDYFSENWTWNKYKNKPFNKIKFSEFTASTEDPAWLAAAFLICYEKPASIDSKDNPTIAGNAEEERINACEARGKLAEKWYDYISNLPLTISNKKLRIDELKAISISGTSVKLSFLVRNVKTIQYVLDSSSFKAPKAVGIKNSGIKNNTMEFTVKDLIPNTTYTLTLEASDKTGADDESGNTVTKVIRFTTAKDLPESVVSVELTANDSKLPNEKFKLTVMLNSDSLDWGYWKKNGYGYTMQLYVNGRLCGEHNLASLPPTFNLKDYFKYELKVGDVVQIGIRTWVNYENEKLYDNYYAKISNPICMLKKPVTAYLSKVNKS